MNLDSLIAEFSKLPCSQVGRGPRHPTDPQPGLERAISEHLVSYPFLRTYEDFTTFLECYAGLAIWCPNRPPEQEVTLVVFGFGEFEEGLADPIDPQGFYQFASNTFQDTKGHETAYTYGFDASGHRQTGVHRRLFQPKARHHGTYSYFCPSFSEWLERMVAAEGRLR